MKTLYTCNSVLDDAFAFRFKTVLTNHSNHQFNQPIRSKTKPNSGLFSRAWHRMQVFPSLQWLLVSPHASRSWLFFFSLFSTSRTSKFDSPTFALTKSYKVVSVVIVFFFTFIQTELKSTVLLFVAESRFLFGVSSRMSLWEQISINFAVLVNMLVAFFYPFADGPGGRCHSNTNIREFLTFESLSAVVVRVFVTFSLSTQSIVSAYFLLKDLLEFASEVKFWIR